MTTDADLTPELDEPASDVQVQDDPAPEPITGLTLVKSEWHGDHGDEHHWFTVPAGHSAADYQAELDAFLEQRATITLDDITVTPEN